MAGSAPERTRSGVRRVAVLDGFRAYAILGVVVIHLLGMSGALAATGGSTFSVVTWGVLGNVIDFFFIISGFVLFLPMVLREGRPGSLRRYALGRAARLVPAYWLSLAVVLALIVLVPPPPAFATPGLASVGLHLGALQMPARLLDGSFAIGFGVNGPVWMLSVIVGFYAVLPLIARPYFHHPLAGLAIAAMIAIGWKEAVLHLDGLFEALAGPGQPPLLVRLIATDQLPGWAFSFALGMTGAWAYVRHQCRGAAGLARRWTWAAAASLAAYCAFAYLIGRHATTISEPFVAGYARGEPLISVGSSASRAVLMATVALGPAWLQRPFANRPARRLGELSYSLYLIHVALGIYAASLLGLPTNGTVGDVALWFAVVVPASLAYAWVAVRLVERPVRRWAAKHDARAREQSQPPITTDAPRLASGAARGTP